LPPQALSRRDFLRLAGMAVEGAGLNACSQPGIGPKRRPSQKAEWVYQDSGAGWFLPMVAGLIDQFNEAHPNIRVDYSAEPQNQADIDRLTTIASF